MVVTVSEDRMRNLRALRNMGLTYKEVGAIYSTSGTQVYYWLIGRNVPHHRPKPEACEICNKQGILDHHHWNNPNLGVHLCSLCHMAAERLDKIPDFPERYFELKRMITQYES